MDLKNDDGDIFKIHIDKTLLNNYEKVNERSKLYEINGKIFSEENTLVENQYRVFEVYEVTESDFFKMEDHENMDKYCYLPDDEDMDDSNSNELISSIQKVPHGVIINSIIYLTDHNWNTLVFFDTDVLKCLVCDKRLVLLECPEHMTNVKHERNLEFFKPLPDFELSIVREINNEYHCGVCNEIIKKNNCDEHFDGKTHSDNQLFAYNKASDVIYDDFGNDNNRNRNNDCYHFKSTTINNDESDNYSEFTSESVDFDYEYDIDTDSNVSPIPGITYASMARKPKLYNQPRCITIMSASKISYNVPFDCWNMIIINKNNTFYCMACKSHEHVKFKVRHCSESSHVENLHSFKTVVEFHNHLVRMVSERLYHCAHCNQLQLVHDMENHLDRKHPIRNKNVEATVTEVNNVTKNVGRNTNNNAKNRNNSLSYINDNSHNRNDLHNNNKIEQLISDNVRNNNNNNTKNTNNNINDNARNRNNNTQNTQIVMKTALTHLNEKIVLQTFGLKVTITLMAYNVICVNDNEFLCGLCMYKFEAGYIVKHIQDLIHIQQLQTHHFLPQYGTHLIRHIHGALHCGICNTPVNPNVILVHLTDPYHGSLLTRALSATVQYLENPESNFNIIQNDAKTKPAETKPIIEETETVLQETERNEMLQETEIEMDESFDSETFDFESYVYIKFKGYYKVTVASFNSLVAIGNGSRHCFVCNMEIEYENIQKHIDSREHEKNVDDYKFLDKYGENLIRQSYLLYHCCICNVIIKYSELTNHFTWQPHVESLRKMNSVIKKQRKNEVQKGEIKMHVVDLKKEQIYLTVREPEINILFSAVIIGNKAINKKKLFIIKDIVLKISFEAWHGVAAIKNGFKCILCQIDVSKDMVTLHVGCEEHIINLENEILREYPTSLVRKINEEIYNCVICNIELSSKINVIKEHIVGKKHKKNYDLIKEYSSGADSYSDCEGDVVTI